MSWLLADAIRRQQRGAFHLGLYPALHSDKLGKTADRRSVFRQPAPCVRHIDQDSSVGSVGGASRQSKAFDGVLPIIVVGTQDRPLPFPRVPGATKVRRKRVGHLRRQEGIRQHPGSARFRTLPVPAGTPLAAGMSDEANARLMDVCRTGARVM